MKEIIAIPQNDDPIHIDTSQIPEIELRLLCKATLDLVQSVAEEYFKDPENGRRFEEWQAAREKEAGNGKVSKRRG